MALKGDLASVDLAQVFQMLALNKKAGLLSIQSQRTWNVLYFDHRGVTSYYNPHQVLERVVTACTRSGRLDARVVDETRDHAAQVKLSLVECLLAGGYLSQEETENLIRSELEEEIYDLFFCKDAKFDFLEGLDRIDGRDGVVDERFFFNTDSVIMEAARRIDEWSYICERIPNSLEVYRPVATPQDCQQEAAAVYELIDGRRNVGRVIEVSGLGNFQVFKHLCQMLDAGCITALAPEDFIDAGDACMREGRLQDAINLYEKSVALGVGVPNVHSKAAEAYQAAQEYENALYHLKCEAEYRLAAGDQAGAAAKLHTATQIVPTDLAARERLVELTLGNADVVIDGLDPVAAGKVLVELFLEVGDHRRMRNMLERLLRVQPDDLDLKKMLVNLHTKAGDHKRVVELYESIANDLVRLDRPIEAVGYLQKILMLDRSRHDISEKLRELYVCDESARRRRRMMAFLAAVAVVVVALGFVYRSYDRAALEAFEGLDVQGLLAADQFTEAASVYETFAATHPFTRVLDRVREESLRIDALRRKHEAGIAAAQAAVEQDLQRLRTEYRAEWARHEQLFKDSKPEAALAAVRHVLELLHKTGRPDDAAWALQQQVEKTAVKLQDYLATAARLAKESETRFAAGDWEAARVAALRVLADFDLTAVARQVKVPVRLTSRPAGAGVLVGGKPLLLGPDRAPARTPVVMLIEPGRPAEFTLELAGFSPEHVSFDAKATATKDVVMRVLAAHAIRMPGRLQTGIGVGGGWIVAGLAGGKLGVARTDSGASREIQLGGLKQVDSIPVVHGGSVFFLSNEQTIECYQLELGTSPAGWPVAIGSQPQTDLTVREGRICLVDQQNNLLCWDLVNGHRLWSLPLECSPSSAPELERRTVRVATTDGRVLLADATDGRVRGPFRSPIGITTRVFVDAGVMYYGAADGTVRAVSEGNGKTLWSTPVGSTVGDGEMVLSATHVIVLGGGRMFALQREDGKASSEAQLTGTPRRGLKVCGKRVFVSAQVPKDKDKPGYDLVQAFDLDRLTLLWEYVSQGALVAELAADDHCIFVPQVTGEIVLFR